MIEKTDKKLKVRGKLISLTQLRNLHGRTLDDAAAKLAISKSYMFYLENGQRRLSLDNADKLAKMYSVDLDTINRLYSVAKKKAGRKHIEGIPSMQENQFGSEETKEVS